MNIFDEFIVGNVDNINWCFELNHFNQRLSDNNIRLDYIKKMIMEEDFIRYEYESDNTYSVYYPAPPTKNYKEIKLVLSCKDTTISILTVIPMTKKLKNEKHEKLKKKRDKAYASVNNNFI